jgi:MFS transporter, DHA1 family, multidrug resistance protein
VLRGLQALGAAGAPVLARAMVRDLYQGARAGRELARMGAIMALAPVAAPSLGGVLQSLFGWRASFLAMAAFGMGAVAVVARLLPETMTRPPAVISLPSILRNYGRFLGHRSYLRYLAIAATSYGGMFAWVSGASFALQDLYGLSPLAFGLVFAIATLGYGVGALASARLVGRIGIDRTIVCGGLALAAGGASMVAAVTLDLRSPLALALPMALYLAGIGLTLPQSMAGALTPFPDRAGAAASLLGFLQQATGSTLGIVVGHALGASALPLALIIATMGGLALALALVNRSMREA